MPLHHSNPKCDICGERHAADHPIECRDGLAAEVVLKREELADAEADLDQEREKNAKLREQLLEVEEAAANLHGYCERLDAASVAHKGPRIRGACQRILRMAAATDQSAEASQAEGAKP